MTTTKATAHRACHSCGDLFAVIGWPTPPRCSECDPAQLVEPHTVPDYHPLPELPPERANTPEHRRKRWRELRGTGDVVAIDRAFAVYEASAPVEWTEPPGVSAKRLVRDAVRDVLSDGATEPRVPLRLFDTHPGVKYPTTGVGSAWQAPVLARPWRWRRWRDGRPWRVSSCAVAERRSSAVANDVALPCLVCTKVLTTANRAKRIGPEQICEACYKAWQRTKYPTFAAFDDFRAKRQSRVLRQRSPNRALTWHVIQGADVSWDNGDTERAQCAPIPLAEIV